ncbi:hypothetical protein Taro_043352, partial [Colocasia esculenta]|nr:hypothetical protein [Colocasia esculenta]
RARASEKEEKGWEPELHSLHPLLRPERRPGGPLVSTLLDLVSTHYPKTAQKTPKLRGQASPAIPQRLAGLHITSPGFPKPLSFKPNPFATRKTSLGSFARGEETLTLAVRKPEVACFDPAIWSSSGDLQQLEASWSLEEGFPDSNLLWRST